jgi:nucleoside-diphosphate-sugar epimerase
MKKVFVTGGTGMTGAHLLLKLVEKGYEVKALKRRTSNTKFAQKIFNYHSKKGDEYYSKIEWIDGDLLDFDILNDSIKNVDHVYHTAAWVSFKPKDKQKMIINNVQGTANIVNACLENSTEKLCHCSSVASLGETGDGSELNEETEKTDYDNVSGYAVSKHRSEMEAWRGVAEGLKTVIVNPSVIMGAGNWDQGSPRMIKAMWEGLKYYTNGQNGFIDVRDDVNLMILLTESEISGERFILTGENHPFRTIFNMIADNLGVERPSKYANTLMLNTLKTVDKIRYYVSGKEPRLTKHTLRSSQIIHTCSNQKVKKYINYDFTPLDQTIKDICKIFLDEMKSNS